MKPDFEGLLAALSEGGVEFAIRGLSLDALIEAKRAMGRPRDLHTADELEVLQKRREGSAARVEAFFRGGLSIAWLRVTKCFGLPDFRL